MDNTNKNAPKIGNQSPPASYNPWNLLFRPRNRTESETSMNSNPQNYQTGSQCGDLQRQNSKSNEEYLWMMWRS
uniref:Uncharacterized protein n=1 Tax=Picea sitchensis TaxID=3332 RepID=A9NTQ8_PICSI|nr:unknown [Picea sitchensis]